MFTKIIILFVMLIIAGSLFSGLFFLVKDEGNSKRMVKALTIRIGISLILFIFLMIGFKFGYLKPHGV